MERGKKMIKVEVFLEQEQIEEIFENVEVRFSKAKLKKLKEFIADQEMDIKEQLEERLAEVLEEIISEEWEK
jgi:hypothetical protein